MNPPYKDGDTVQVIAGYYRCNTPEKGDIVIANQGAKTVIKRVMMLPGEEWIIENETIIVHEEPLMNSQGEIIRIIDERTLSLYSSPLADNTYMLLSEQQGGRDSREYGPTHISDIIGKVIVE